MKPEGPKFYYGATLGWYFERTQITVTFLCFLSMLLKVAQFRPEAEQMVTLVIYVHSDC